MQICHCVIFTHKWQIVQVASGSEGLKNPPNCADVKPGQSQNRHKDARTNRDVIHKNNAAHPADRGGNPTKKSSR